MEEYASSVWLDWNHQGAVISPILANVYLDDFDEIFSTADLKLVRYADDFVLMARSQKQIVQAKAEVAQVLGSMGLQLHPDKTQLQVQRYKRCLLDSVPYQAFLRSV